MEPKEVIALFDSCWFKHEIFNQKSFKSIFEKKQNQENPLESKLSTSSILMRSKSDELVSFSSYNSDIFSPKSVLRSTNLQTIPSQKEIKEQEPIIKVQEKTEEKTEENRGTRNRGIRRRSRKKGGFSKSLSELEFEELKGFMDLGFVFSEQDLDSNLVEIIPGLQRLGKKTNGVDQEDVHVVQKNPQVSRPYLSEAWAVWEREKRVHKPFMKWRIADMDNEIHMKDSLKLWAHTVASAVR